MAVLPMEVCGCGCVCVTVWGVFMIFVRGCVCVWGVCVGVSPIIYVQFSVDNKVHNAAFLLIKSTIEKTKTRKQQTNKNSDKNCFGKQFLMKS